MSIDVLSNFNFFCQLKVSAFLAVEQLTFKYLFLDVETLTFSRPKKSHINKKTINSFYYLIQKNLIKMY